MAKQEVDPRVEYLEVRFRALIKNMKAIPEVDRFITMVEQGLVKMEADVKHAQNVYESRVAKREAVSAAEEAAKLAEMEAQADKEADEAREELGLGKEETDQFLEDDLIPEDEVPPNEVAELEK